MHLFIDKNPDGNKPSGFLLGGIGMDARVNGTLIWYYYICKREVWLMGHQIIPDQENDNVLIGKIIAEYSYAREKKEVVVDNIKIDVLELADGKFCISEVKKSSRYKQSAKMQLAFYMSKLKERGIEAKGELRFPKEKIREEVVLDPPTEAELLKVAEDITIILNEERPVQPEKQKFCRNCAYAEFCWC